MRIGIKTITGLGIAAALTLGATLPAYADGNNSGDSFANATDNSVTTNLTDAQVQFKYTAITPYSVNFSWNASAMQVNDDNATWCDIMLWNKTPLIAGYDSGETTAPWTTSSYTFGESDNGDGGQDVSVTPGGTFRVQFICHNSTDLIRTNYYSPWFTAPDVPTGAPGKPTAIVYYGTDLLTLVPGGMIYGEAEAASCYYRLYKDGSLYKTVSNACQGAGSYYFSNLPKGTYQIQGATKNSAGMSAWSPMSASYTVKGSSGNTFTVMPVINSTSPSTVNVSFGIRGKNLYTSWSNAKTNKGTAIKNYKVTIAKGKKNVYTHTFGTNHRTFNKTLAKGSYTVKIVAVNKSGKQSTTSTTVKIS